jgi:hypothetical protein
MNQTQGMMYGVLTTDVCCHITLRKQGRLLYNGPSEGRPAPMGRGHFALIKEGRKKTFRPKVLYNIHGLPPSTLEGGRGQPGYHTLEMLAGSLLLIE